jgi:hypothetical protein
MNRFIIIMRESLVKYWHDILNFGILFNEGR